MTVTFDAAGLSLGDNSDTIKDIVQNVINNALVSTNTTMMVFDFTTLCIFIKSLSELYLIFSN